MAVRHISLELLLLFAKAYIVTGVVFPMRDTKSYGGDGGVEVKISMLISVLQGRLLANFTPRTLTSQKTAMSWRLLVSVLGTRLVADSHYDN